MLSSAGPGAEKRTSFVVTPAVNFGDVVVDVIVLNRGFDGGVIEEGRQGAEGALYGAVAYLTDCCLRNEEFNLGKLMCRMDLQTKGTKGERIGITSRSNCRSGDLMLARAGYLDSEGVFHNFALAFEVVLGDHGRDDPATETDVLHSLFSLMREDAQVVFPAVMTMDQLKDYEADIEYPFSVNDDDQALSKLASYASHGYVRLHCDPGVADAYVAFFQELSGIESTVEMSPFAFDGRLALYISQYHCTRGLTLNTSGPRLATLSLTNAQWNDFFTFYNNTDPDPLPAEPVLAQPTTARQYVDACLAAISTSVRATGHVDLTAALSAGGERFQKLRLLVERSFFLTTTGNATTVSPWTLAMAHQLSNVHALEGSHGQVRKDSASHGPFPAIALSAFRILATARRLETEQEATAAQALATLAS